MQRLLLSEEQARLNFPRPVRNPPRLAAALPVPGSPMSAGPARRAHRRAWLARLSGGALGGFQPLRPSVHPDPLRTLVQRVTQGFTSAEYERARSLGFEGYLEEQLEPFSIDDSATEALLTRFPVLEMSPRRIYNHFDGSQPGTETRPIDAVRQFKSALLTRATSSRRQLQERMCEFWSDHFNVDHAKDLEWLLLPEHERTVIRPHALGSFPALLSACAFSGAMLYYLDNWLNVRGAPQNNYARELLELHTLGVRGGYNEFDVQEVARCFTGWTLRDDPASAGWLRGVFDPALHANGPKLVLGHVIAGSPPSGRPGQPVERDDAQAVLDILAAHPSTARFLATKLIRRFLTPTPPADLVDEVAATYRATQGDIRAMLRVILTPANLAPDSGRVAPKYRRPIHFLTSLVRAMGGRVDAPTAALEHLVAMGQSPYDCELPTGYPEDFPAWGDSLLPRWSFAARLLDPDRVLPGVELALVEDVLIQIEAQGPAERPGLAERINERLLGGMLPPAEVLLLQQYVDEHPAPFDMFAVYDCLVLAASLPGFQWH
ncbi:MAG TPA: DUF1800 domain-containing protein [Planctomycetota bacterium]